MNPVISAFEDSPDRGRGLARDMRVRWALEEAGQPYDVELVSFAELKQPAYLAWQPFGQIPAYRVGDFKLFESGAVVLHIAETHSGLLPDDPAARARAITWMFAATSTMEPPVIELEIAILLEGKESWSAERQPMVEDRLRKRMKSLSDFLGDREWLDGEFSAGDLMMVEVLLRPAAQRLIGEFPNLGAYTERAQQRPAFKRAFAAQHKVFTDRHGEN